MSFACKIQDYNHAKMQVKCSLMCHLYNFNEKAAQLGKREILVLVLLEEFPLVDKLKPAKAAGQNINMLQLNLDPKLNGTANI